MTDFDLVVLGGGSAGESIAKNVASAPGKVRVAVVEEQRVGGECPFVSCMPSKALLRSASARHMIGRSVELGATASQVRLDDAASAFAAAVRRRDEVAEHRDDAAKAESLASAGALILYSGRAKTRLSTSTYPQLPGGAPTDHAGHHADQTTVHVHPNAGASSIDPRRREDLRGD